MKVTESHEWLVQENELARVGITDHAQKELGEIVFVQLPEVGSKVEAGEEVAVLESTKAASDIYSPVSGTITEVNGLVKEDPSLLNRYPESEGWLFKIQPSSPSEIDALMDMPSYLEMLSS